MSRPAPGRLVKLSYGLGAVAFGVKDNGFSYFLLLYYNQVLGLPERLVGLGIMVALLLDAFADPFVGHLSDHLHSRWGRRHPFMYAAALPVAVSYYFLWSPPAGLSPTGLLVYFLVVSILVRTFITLYEIPSTSLVAELTDRYDDRTTLVGYRFFFGWWGGLTMALLAFAFFLQPDATHPVGQLNPNGYRGYGLASALVILGAILVSSVGTHSYIPHLRKPPALRPAGVLGALREMQETLANRSFLALFGAAIFGSMATGLLAALNIYFTTYFWELTARQISILVLPNFVSAGLAFGVTPGVARRFGKKRAAILTACAALLLGPSPVVLRLLGAFPSNASPALLPTLVLFNATTVTLLIMSSILIASMLADVVEDSEVTTQRRSEGLLFAANSFVQKAVSGIGVFASSLVLAAVGFPRDARPGAVDPAVIERLGVLFTVLLVGLYMMAIACLSTYRIDRAAHEANLRKLADRPTP
jgi:glycoside/pentoside/hexuronide:cation symporter, GPH family